MNISRVSAILLRQFYLIRDNPTRFVSLFSWVLFDVVIWGFTTKYLSEIVEPTFNVVAVFLGAIVLWEFLIRAMTGITMSFFEDVWARNFINIFASPIRIREYLLGLVVSSVGMTMLGFIAMVVVGSFAFGLSFSVLGFSLVGYLLILFLFGVALGIFGLSIVLRFGPSAEWFVWPMPALLNPFVGVFYPITILPHWMQYISAMLPPSYVFEGMRAIVTGSSASSYAFLIGLLLSGLYIVVACMFFFAVFRRALKTGLIARYSAETLS